MVPSTAARLGTENAGSRSPVGKLGYLLLYVVLIVVAAFQLFPLVWLLLFH